MSGASDARELGSPSVDRRAKALGPFLDVDPGRAAVPVPVIRELLVVTDPDEELDTSVLEREFPSVSVRRADSSAHDARGVDEAAFVVDELAWRGSFDLARFDEAIASAPRARVVVRGPDAAGVAAEVLSRYQRLVLRRNAASATPAFDAALREHAALHDLRRPSGRLDHEHALDTWQWVLRLLPSAGLVPQLAALFHDVERLDADPHERLEHRAVRTPTDRDLRAPRTGRSRPVGPDHARAAMLAAGVERADVERACDAIAGTQPSPDASILDEADGLSFLSLLSHRYADHFGLAQTRRKVSFIATRLRRQARAKLALVRLRPDVHRLVQPG